MLPIAPYVVLDQNAFRDERQLAPAIAKSLRFVADHPELVVVGRGIPDLFRIEKASGQPSIADLGWPELTDSFRRLLNELRQNKDGDHVAFVRREIVAAQATASHQYLDHETNKARVRSRLGVTREEICQYMVVLKRLPAEIIAAVEHERDPLQLREFSLRRLLAMARGSA